MEGGLRETHGETNPAQLAQTQEKERKKWEGRISLAKHPLGLNPGLTPDHHNSLTIASTTAWEIQSWQPWSEQIYSSDVLPGSHPGKGGKEACSQLWPMHAGEASPLPRGIWMEMPPKSLHGDSGRRQTVNGTLGLKTCSVLHYFFCLIRSWPQ